MFRNWGAHYPNGAIVLAMFDDGLGLMVVVDNTGDYHHRSIRARIQNDSNTPVGKDRLVADPKDVYYSYYAGPVVAQLSSSELLFAASGVYIDKILLGFSMEELQLVQADECQRRPYKAR